MSRPGSRANGAISAVSVFCCAVEAISLSVGLLKIPLTVKVSPLLLAMDTNLIASTLPPPSWKKLSSPPTSSTSSKVFHNSEIRLSIFVRGNLVSRSAVWRSKPSGRIGVRDEPKISSFCRSILPEAVSGMLRTGKYSYQVSCSQVMNICLNLQMVWSDLATMI